MAFDSFGDTDPTKMPMHLFHRAKHLAYSTAQRANISQQNYAVCPRHWYIDATIHCCDCRQDFVFSANEQHFWYEDRKFYVDSFPRRCAACRRQERSRLENRQRYDAMIDTVLARNAPIDQKQQIIAIIDELEEAEGDLPEKLKQNRATLIAQLRKE